MIGAQEIVGVIIPLPVWIIPFPIFKTSFELVDKIKKQAGAELCQAQLSLKLASHKVASSQFLAAISLAA